MTDIETFLEDYRATWEAVCRDEADLGALTGFFATPCFIVDLDGRVMLYSSAKELLSFNETRCSTFQAGGVSHCRFRGIDTVSQGPHVVLAIVNWELLTGTGDVERAWRHYYTIGREADQCRILVSAFQTGA